MSWLLLLLPSVFMLKPCYQSSANRQKQSGRVDYHVSSILSSKTITRKGPSLYKQKEKRQMAQKFLEAIFSLLFCLFCLFCFQVVSRWSRYVKNRADWERTGDPRGWAVLMALLMSLGHHFSKCSLPPTCIRPPLGGEFVKIQLSGLHPSI